jgi:hypothetical protein
MYKVRVKQYESKTWKVIAEFEKEKDAKRYAIDLDMLNRKSIDTMCNGIDIKYPDGSRLSISP